MNTIADLGQVTRIRAAIVVVIITGFWALVSLFSDFPSQWSYTTWILYILTGHALAGFLVGVLLPLQWRLSIAAVWGAMLVSIAGVVGMLRPGEMSTSPSVPLLSRVVPPVLLLVVVPAIVMLGGYAGSRFANRRSPTRIG